MDSSEFYQNLPCVSHFNQLTEASLFHEIPHNWDIIVSDVQGSTEALKQGKYKHVNAIGASVIIAVLNIVKPIEVPFVFGGDGASLCVPPGYSDAIKSALLAAQQLARDSFDLHLRIGIVPVAKVIENGFSVKVMRHQVSPNYIQAIFDGGGLSHAETLLKDKRQGSTYLITEGEPAGDFSGLECRWDTVPSRHGETISLLVDSKDKETYRQVLEKIEAIYGVDHHHHPLSTDGLKLTYSQSKLSVETAIRNVGKSHWSKLKYRLKLIWQNILGQIFMGFDMQTGDTKWGQYKPDLVANSDYRKFDDMLRMIIAGTGHQRQQLLAYLEQQYQAGKLKFGIHASTGSLITCLVFQRQSQHIHFIDGCDGGYAMAATQLKSQIKASLTP